MADEEEDERNPALHSTDLKDKDEGTEEMLQSTKSKAIEKIKLGHKSGSEDIQGIILELRATDTEKKKAKGNTRPGECGGVAILDSCCSYSVNVA